MQAFPQKTHKTESLKRLLERKGNLFHLFQKFHLSHYRYFLKQTLEKCA